jgi:hypothetical protein
LTSESQIKTNEKGPDEIRALQAPAQMDPRQKSLALGLEFAKRSVKTRSIEDLYLLLTNDIRILGEFDRSFLIVHLGGKSILAAVGNQPVLEHTSRFSELVRDLAEPMKEIAQAVLVAGKDGVAGLTDEQLPGSAREALQAYLTFSKSSNLFCVPLINDDVPVAHLFLEFFDAGHPDNITIVTILNIAPFLASALVERWLKSKKPSLLALLDPRSSITTRYPLLKRRLQIASVVLIIVILVLFVVPFPFMVGGEADVVPTKKHVAYCKIEGLIDRVYTAEGSHVARDQVLATLDPKELDYKIKSAEKQFEILTNEMNILRAAANEDPSKLAESRLVELKRDAAWQDLNYYKWQQQFLAIRAPVAGIVLTKDIESLAGKKLRDGEPFCEIAEPGELSVDVFVPQDRIAFVKKGQELTVFLDADPRKGYSLTVNEIAPMAEAVPRLGNVYRVRSPFTNAPKTTLVGMKGTGSIHAMNSSLWSVMSLRLLERWQQLSLSF